MEPSPDQIAAARARGCAFSPATDDQVRRFAAQRRVFRIEGRPHVATRGGGFFETWATLAALIEGHRAAAPEPGAETGTASMEHHAPHGDAGAPPDPIRPDAAEAEQDRRDAAAAAPRRRRAARPEPARAYDDAAPAADAAGVPSEAEDMLAGVAAAQGSGPKARTVARGRRAGQPPTPRWMVAGKMRRGRLK